MYHLNLLINALFPILHLQTVFLMKRNPLELDEEEMAQFARNLQSLGIPLNSYIGAYKNTTHVHAIEDKKRFDGISQDTPKKRKLNEMAGTSSQES